MPTYSYRCSACGHRFDKRTSVAERREQSCPVCGEHSELLISTGISAPGQEKFSELPPEPWVGSERQRKELAEQRALGGEKYYYKHDGEFWHEDLDRKPVKITSKEQLKRELKTRGLHNPHL